MMDFKNARELLDLCSENHCPISTIMRERECDQGETTSEEADGRMRRVLEIMRSSATEPIEKPGKSMGGLIGGEARKLAVRREHGQAICGTVMSRAISGIVPGLLLALQEEYGLTDDRLIDALYNAGAVGYLAMRNATVAGAVGGCQAEVGIASAMAASAAVELMEGTPEQCLYAASTVLMNMLGLVCDPVGGLVEYPCQHRNASGVANALIAAEISLSGIRQLIPFDEMLATMYSVGKKLPSELRETALGGCASTPSACQLCHLSS